MIYGYVRVSSDKQTTQNQIFEINSFAKSNNLKIDNWINETISGLYDVKKRKLGKLLKKMKKGDIMISSELSRLGRNLLQVMSILSRPRSLQYGRMALSIDVAYPFLLSLGFIEYPI